MNGIYGLDVKTWKRSFTRATNILPQIHSNIKKSNHSPNWQSSYFELKSWHSRTHILNHNDKCQQEKYFFFFSCAVLWTRQQLVLVSMITIFAMLIPRSLQALICVYILQNPVHESKSRPHWHERAHVTLLHTSALLHRWTALHNETPALSSAFNSVYVVYVVYV